MTPLGDEPPGWPAEQTRSKRQRQPRWRKMSAAERSRAGAIAGGQTRKARLLEAERVRYGR